MHVAPQDGLEAGGTVTVRLLLSGIFPVCQVINDDSLPIGDHAFTDEDPMELQKRRFRRAVQV